MDVEANPRDDDKMLSTHRGAIFALAVAAYIVVFLPMHLSLFLDRSLVVGGLITATLMGTVPFVLARITPRAASFETSWFPKARLHWLWFLGMVLALFVCYPIAALLIRPFGIGKNTTLEIPTTGSVIFTGVFVIVICPIAEEIFWRGYFLEQLRKVAPSWAAVLIQSALFALEHLHGYFGPYASIQAFFLGIVLGTWRVRFRSLLPLILAHMIFNAVATVPRLKELYEITQISKPFADDLAKTVEKARTDPKCRQIAALAKRPADEAVPAIIEYFADPDEDVRTYAMTVVDGCFRREAEPFLRQPLKSRDKKVVDTALSLVAIERYSRFKQEVRDIAWSGDFDLMTQISAVETLLELKDEDGLRRIAQGHPSMKIRAAAEHRLKLLSNRANAQ